VETALQPLLVIAPGCPRFDRWRRDHGLPLRLAKYVTDERYLRGVTGGHVVIVDRQDLTPRQEGLVALLHQLAGQYQRLTVHRGTTAERPDCSGEELQNRYGNQAAAPAAPLLAALGRAGDADRAVAYRYDSMDTLDAFAAGNRRHHGHETIGPLIGPDGLIYAVILLNLDSPQSTSDHAAAADPG
jgi:hypothetical protein